MNWMNQNSWIEVGNKVVRSASWQGLAAIACMALVACGNGSNEAGNDVINDEITHDEIDPGDDGNTIDRTALPGLAWS